MVTVAGFRRSPLSLDMQGLEGGPRHGIGDAAREEDRDGAALVGIDATRVTLLVFAISGALAAVAAVLYSPINLVYPAMGHLVITKAFVIIILGGMGSIPGAIVGGLIIGFAESFGAYYISTDYKDIIAFVLLVVILSLRPQGLFAKRSH